MKPRSDQPPHGRRQAFRNCQVAAPLKLPGAGRACGKGLSLPQLSSCGPIEAPGVSAMPHAQVSLPQLSSCGPIEAPPFVTGTDTVPPLPQLSSCGPIEACGFLRLKTSQFGPFRNCQVAAPLKHMARGPFPWLRPAFRNCQVAAPLKRGRRRRACARGRPSATVKLRPH